MVRQMKTKPEVDAVVNGAENKLVVIDFTASWCPPCRMIAPKFEEISNENQDVDFIKVDVDENSETSESYGISCMPTFIFLKNGKVLEKMEGANEAKLRELVAKYK